MNAQASPTNQASDEASVTRPSPGDAGVRASARRNPTRKPESQSADAGFSQALEQQISQAIQPIFSQALEQQITQAIQPALNEFRQRMTQELSDQIAAMPRQGDGQPDTGQESAPAAPEAAPQQHEGEQARESQTQQAHIPVRNIQHARERALSGVLPSAVQMVGRFSAQWLQSLLAAGLGALLAESTHAAIQQRAEQGLRPLLQKAFEAAPPNFANQEMREKIERTLQLILREALGAVFAEGVRASVQQGGQQTIQYALRGDFGGALKKVEETPRVMMAALIAVLRRHQQTIVRLLLTLLLLEVGSALEPAEKAK